MNVTFIILILINLSFAGIGLPHSVLGSAWPVMYNDINSTVTSLGFISMLLMFGTTIASFFTGKLLQLYNSGIIITSGLFLIFLSLCGFALSSNFIFICISAVPLGIGTGLTDATLNSYSAAHYGAKHMNWQHCMWGLGAATGPVLMAYGMAINSWRTGYFIIGGAVLVILLFLFLSLPMWKRKLVNNETAQNLIKTPQNYKTLFKLRGFKLSLVIFLTYVAAETSIGLWGSSYLVFAKNIPPETAARWISLYFVGITAGRFFSGLLAVLLSSKQLVWLGCIVFGCGIITTQIPLGNATLTLMSGFLIMGLGCAPVFPTLMHLTPSKFGTDYSKMAVGVQVSSAYAGSAMIPPLYGLIAAQFGNHLLPVFLGVLLLIFTTAIYLYNKIN